MCEARGIKANFYRAGTAPPPVLKFLDPPLICAMITSRLGTCSIEYNRIQFISKKLFDHQENNVHERGEGSPHAPMANILY